MTITIRLTVPVLERLLEADPEAMVELSHAAVGAVREKYSEVLLTPEIKSQMQREVDRAISEAKEIATLAVEQQLGQWNKAGWGSKFTLRPEVMASIKSATDSLVCEAVKQYLESDSVKAMMDHTIISAVKKAVDKCVAEGLDRFLDKKKA